MATRPVMTMEGIARRRTFHPVVMVLVSALALVAQSYMGYKLPRLALIDLPLLTVVYFSIVLRSPLTGTLGGTALGLAQDALGGHLMGVNGMLKAMVGYAAASLGVRLDVENPMVRLLLAALFTLGNSVVGFVIVARLAGMEMQWMWLHETARVLANGALAAPYYWLLDKLRRRD